MLSPLEVGSDVYDESIQLKLTRSHFSVWQLGKDKMSELMEEAEQKAHDCGAKHHSKQLPLNP